MGRIYPAAKRITAILSFRGKGKVSFDEKLILFKEHFLFGNGHGQIAVHTVFSSFCSRQDWRLIQNTSCRADTSGLLFQPGRELSVVAGGMRDLTDSILS